MSIHSATARGLIFAAIVLVGFATAWGLYTLQQRFFGAQLPATPDTWATVLNPARVLPDFTLTDHHGRPLTKASLVGHWTYLYFGYTHCPDVCPTTLTTLAAMDKAATGKVSDADRPEVIFVSVDPARDTPATLAKYVPYFDPRFVGATGTPAQLEALTKPLGINYVAEPAESGGDYLVNHSASLLLVNPRAQLQALSSPPHRAATLLKDYRKIIARWR